MKVRLGFTSCVGAAAIVTALLCLKAWIAMLVLGAVASETGYPIAISFSATLGIVVLISLVAGMFGRPD